MSPTQHPPSQARQIGGDHYVSMAVQPWTAMRAWMTPEQMLGFLRGNAIKYLARAGHKDAAIQDLKKARHYLDRLIEMLEEPTANSYDPT